MTGARVYLTIDTEFWDSPQYFGLAENKHKEFGNQGCCTLLDLFRRLRITTTFFVSVEFAQQHPETVYRIVEDGHELASHSYSHVRFDELESGRRHFEVSESKRYLEERFGVPINGFRSPGNLIDSDHFLLLRNAGYRYDSSIHPAFLPHQPLGLFKSKSLFHREAVVEIPISTLGGLPVSWVWMRNSGVWLARLAVHYNRLFNRHAVFYLHSWEFEPLPSMKGLPAFVTRKTGTEFVNMLETFITGLKNRGFSFGHMNGLADEYLNDHSTGGHRAGGA